MSRCYDMDVYFDDGATEKPRFDLIFLTNLKTLLIFMEKQPISTTFSLTIWGFRQYLVLYLSSNTTTTATSRAPLCSHDLFCLFVLMIGKQKTLDCTRISKQILKLLKYLRRGDPYQQLSCLLYAHMSSIFCSF